MGSQLHARVTALAMDGHLDGLSDQSYVVLLAMAVVARDKDTKTAPARLDFGGWEWLARAALRRSTYDLASKQAVGRAIRQLRDAGLIKQRGRIAGQQSTVVYELHI